LIISFTLNNKVISIDVEPDKRVIDVLREDLQLTGTKEGCGSGECGACTIHVNGESRLSCLMLAAQLEGKDITTIEGISIENKMHSIQEAFIQYGAVQCGFCTPGMIMSAKALLDANDKPTEEEIKDAVAGNLCRCTGYVKIIDAIKSAAGGR